MSAIAELQERIRAAAAQSAPLRIVGAGSKDFYGGELTGEPLRTTTLNGIVAYEPAELVVTALAGTPLADVEAALAARRQMLAFEPPRFEHRGTIGGAVAAGLSGPRRAYAGAIRDYVLGVRVIDGQGRALRFGGQVIKNVAGFDVSRLFAGSLGTLGLITEVTLKTLPQPAHELTVIREADAATAVRLCNEWAGQPLPLSATCHHEGRLYVRLSGATAAVEAAVAQLGGERLEPAATFWSSLRDHTHAFFASATTVWRLSVPSTVAPIDCAGPQLIEWGGALRWLTGDVPSELRERLAKLGGHATCFRAPTRNAAPFQPPPPALLELQRRLQHAFDPRGIFAAGRLYL